eukprot:TRINITY_DN103307_c0_g1_i1.p1 TRINITY_DN103307_c0_g1~~TRINITY_DN103307_c0_g1_i1.p1  ORF type:complete len:543 (+),score=90.80 TRINITY_DN103307_c0_g1_i1:164-1792(+)
MREGTSREMEMLNTPSSSSPPNADNSDSPSVSIVAERVESRERKTRVSLTTAWESAPPPALPALGPDFRRLRLMQFIKGTYFQGAVGVAIAANAVVLAFETDYSDWPFWPFVDNVFLLIFGIELALRLFLEGVDFFVNEKAGGNIMDFSIVVFGITDSVVLPLIMDQEGGGSNGSKQVLRVALKFFRLLRLVRLLRFVKMIKRLNDFAVALYTIIGPFMVVIVILFGSTFFVAIILTEVFAHPEGGMPNSEMHDPVEEHNFLAFRDVCTSFFTLFRVITTDNWIGVAEPVIRRHGVLWRVFFMVFIMFLTWVMISILTAVASDNVITATSDRLEREIRETERRHKEFLNFVSATFREADQDSNGLVDREEFEALLEEMNLAEMLQQLNIPVTKDDLYRTWEMLDVSERGVLTIDEFVDGLSFLGENSVTTRHIVNVDYNIRRIAHKLFFRVNRLFRKLEIWRSEEVNLVSQVAAHEVVLRQQTELLSLWRVWASKEHPGSFPAQLEGAARAQELHDSEFMIRDARGCVWLAGAQADTPNGGT